MKPLLLVLLVLVQFVLVACGGGGGGGSTEEDTSGSGLPDLVITAFAAPTSANATDTFTVTGTVKNQGGSVAAGGGVIINLSPFSDVAIDGLTIALTPYIGVLESGQSANFSIPVKLLDYYANGNYYIGAVAVYADEASKSNNARSQAITINNGTACTSDVYEPDSSATSARPLEFGVSQLHNHCEATSDWMSFSATAGTTYGISTAPIDTVTFHVLFIYDTNGSTELVRFNNVSSHLNWTAPSTGTYYLRVGSATFGSETDYNVLLGDLRPDLTIPDISVSNTKLLPGGSIYVHDTVYNQGFIAAGSFDVDLYLSTDSVVTTSDTWIGKRTVTSLAIDQGNYGPTNDSPYSLPANLAPGTYYLAAIANPTNSLNEFATTNNVSPVKTINVEALGLCSPDLYEEDDAAINAGEIVVDAAVQAHNHCDDTADWLKFTAIAGNNYSMRAIRSGLSIARLELYGLDGTTLLSGNGTAAIDWQAPTAGVYYVKVTGTPGAGTDYTVQLQRQLPDLAQTLSLPYGTTVTAGGFLKLDDAVTNVGYQASGPFEIGFYCSADGTVTTTDTLGATRTLTNLSELLWQSSDGSRGEYMHFPRTLSPGTYYVAAIADRLNTVAELDETNNTSTPLTVTIVAPPCPGDTYEDDETPATAQTIASGVTQTRNFCDDNIDWIKFTPAANGAYIADTATVMGILELYQADGTTRIEPQAKYFNKLSWYATAGLDYYLKYRSQDQVAGDYQLNISTCAQDAFEEDDTLATAKSIAVGETQTRNNCDDEEDWAKFTAVAGTVYTITANGQNVNLTLYDGDNLHQASGQSIQGGKVKVINWTAPANGTYYIKADSYEFGPNIGYTLNLK